jgi:bifunctional polynucleotide phosphatase/kinase
MTAHTRVNQDSLKTIKACLTAAKDALSQGRSVVVDNTNISVDVRKTWVDFARENKVDVSMYN